MAELVLDVIEQILLKVDVIDLVQCKRVCKSWLSLISTPRFVKAHLDYSYIKNYEFRDKRIIMHHGCCESVDSSFIRDDYHIVGSSNGLVCISPKDVQLLVTNPLTKEVNYLPKVPGIPKTRRLRFRSEPCWGFGYDSSTDDYKVIVGIGIGKHRTRFYVLALKSNIWKLIGDIKYKLHFRCADTTGVLCEGSLHWFMKDRKNEKVIISFDLSLEEFNEIPQPDDLLYKCDDYHKLGFIEESLCIYEHQAPLSPVIGNSYILEKAHYPRIWIMRSYQVTQSWEQVPYRCEVFDVEPQYVSYRKFINHKNPFAFMDYMANPIFVQSLVSPHSNITRLIKTTNDNKDYMATRMFVKSLNITRPIKTANGNKALKRKRRPEDNKSYFNVIGRSGSTLICYMTVPFFNNCQSRTIVWLDRV